MKTRKKKDSKGFTLSEMLVVVIVIAVLGLIAYPIYSKMINRSRASDALNVLSAAAKKQEVYMVNNERYASSFDELNSPVKGLTGNGDVTKSGVEVGHFKYSMDRSCLIAQRAADKYSIYKNYETNKEICVGEGCEAVVGMIPTGEAGDIDCAAKDFGGGGGSGVDIDPCIKNPSSCCKADEEWNKPLWQCVKKGTGKNCTAPKVYNSILDRCVCGNTCSNGGIVDDNCKCKCTTGCADGQEQSSVDCSCSSVCSDEEPYYYGGECHKCAEGVEEKDGKCGCGEPEREGKEEACGAGYSGNKIEIWKDCKWEWDTSGCEAEVEVCSADENKCVNEEGECIEKKSCPCEEGSKTRKRTCLDGSVEVWTWEEGCPGGWKKENECASTLF